VSPDADHQGQPIELEVREEAAGQRLDRFLAQALGLSRAELRRLFDEGAIRVGGRPSKKGDRVATGQRIRLLLGIQDASVSPNPALPLKVLHFDDALVFVDKPAGIPSHPLRPGETGTAANALVARFPECVSASEDPREGGLCHRLDIQTSGVLLAARKREVWLQVRGAFGREEVDKRYWALVSGPIGDEGEIEIPLRHHRRRKVRVEAASRGEPGARPARSVFRVLSRAGQFSLLEVRIITGVLHQVRAHLASIGAPVVGDALYGGLLEEGVAPREREAPPTPRVLLHARSLELVHPTTGRPLRVESPIPSDLARSLAERGLELPAAAAPTHPSP
jgi:23S rRNA pseudouridine1911/1915/1917 synthase